jgi:hypothetical protein
MWKTHFRGRDRHHLDAPPLNPTVALLYFQKLRGKIFREEVFGLVEQTALFAFDEQDEVSSALLHDGAGRLHLRVEGIHQVPKMGR